MVVILLAVMTIRRIIEKLESEFSLHDNKLSNRRRSSGSKEN